MPFFLRGSIHARMTQASWAEKIVDFTILYASKLLI